MSLRFDGSVALITSFAAGKLMNPELYVDK